MEIFSQFLDIVLHLDQHLTLLVAQYGPWAYGILFLIVFMETGFVVTPFLPGDSLLFVAGAVAAAGDMDLGWLMATLVTAALCGDNVNYWFGRFLGPRVFRHEGSRWLKRENLERTHAFMERHGPKAIVMARFVPLVRTFVPFVCGLGRLTYARFLGFSILGALLWVGLLVPAGYFFGSLAWVKSNLTLVILGIIFISLLPGLIEFWRRQARA
ncbi:membrane-associated protein [Sulfuritortus calidifontis]|uniref:Membrane-associated protein n=1 Tax=Sulfuritortus calidifontis TaxID=1914471 RepID=A0A4R3JY25_9PROT|nr:DedA family protein [Sulfuritortus calidifontis]TCS73417.1 membrane-associated protein [Sulfuritortus calidifontis]